MSVKVIGIACKICHRGLQPGVKLSNFTYRLHVGISIRTWYRCGTYIYVQGVCQRRDQSRHTSAAVPGAHWYSGSVHGPCVRVKWVNKSKWVTLSTCDSLTHESLSDDEISGLGVDSWALATEPIGPGGPRPAHFLSLVGRAAHISGPPTFLCDINFFFLYCHYDWWKSSAMNKKCQLNVPRMPQMAV